MSQFWRLVFIPWFSNVKRKTKKKKQEIIEDSLWQVFARIKKNSVLKDDLAPFLSSSLFTLVTLFCISVQYKINLTYLLYSFPFHLWIKIYFWLCKDSIRQLFNQGINQFILFAFLIYLITLLWFLMILIVHSVNKMILITPIPQSCFSRLRYFCNLFQSFYYFSDCCQQFYANIPNKKKYLITCDSLSLHFSLLYVIVNTV